MAKISTEEARWRAEEDARTLTRREEIMASPERREQAMKILRKQRDALNKSLNANTRQSTKKTTSKTTKKK